jgi:trimethylamine---corrinoid protein Co-methyltransferase
MPNLLDKEIIEAIYDSALDILSTIGIEFEMASARELFKKNGAKIDGKRVFISPSLLSKCLDLMPSYHYKPKNRKRLIAGSPFSNSPMVLDDETGQIRQVTIDDAIKMYQLAETSNLYQSVNPGIVDPNGNDSDDKYISQIAMLLKYSDKWPSLGLRATKSNAQNGDVYTSAKKAIQLIKEIKEDDINPVMGQGICPMSPLSYDEESLINLTVLVEERQNVSILPCTLSFMTGPESLIGIVIHDFALCLAGVTYVQLLKPGTSISFNSNSTMTDLRTMQPVYASPEFLNIQIMFYEVCLYFELNCVICGCFADGTRNDYQAGYETCFTAMVPYSMTNVEKIWCYPGHMAAFAGGSFYKMIFDEEVMINCNRILQGLNLSIDPMLKNKLARSIETKSFLTIGDVNIYRKEQRITKIFDKKGIDASNAPLNNSTHFNAKTEIDRRCAEYALPERNKSQKNLLQKYLPTDCKY